MSVHRVQSLTGFEPSRIEYKEAFARLLFGSHETSPIIWIGKPTPAILLVKRREDRYSRNQTLLWWLVSGRLKTQKTKYIDPVDSNSHPPEKE
jgi:hypothetical protein